MRTYTRDLYSRLEAETGPGHRLQAGRVHRAGRRRGPARGVPAGAGVQPLCGVDVHEISAREVGELFPLARTDDVLAGFYVPEDGRANPVDVTMSLARGARQQGVTDRRGRPGARRAHRARRRDRRTHRPGRRRVRGRRERAPACGPASSPPGPAWPSRCRRPSTTTCSPRRSRALRRLAGARGPGELRLLPRGGRRPDARPVRGGLRAVEGRRESRPTSRSSSCRRTGTGWARTSSRRWGASRCLRRRHQNVLLRARELHARPPAGGRAGARGAQLLRRRRTQLDRHPDRRRARSGARALDRRRPTRVPTSPA